MAVDIGLIQAILDKGGYDQLSGKQKQIVDALIAQKAVTPPTANAPPSAQDAQVFDTPMPPQRQQQQSGVPFTQEAPWWGGQAQGDVAGPMSMEGFGNPLPPEDKRAIYQTAGSAAVGGLGLMLGGPGGGVAGGAAGYSIGDTLYEAMNGKSNVDPTNLQDYRDALIGTQGGSDYGALGSLTEGAMFEALPLGIGKVASKMVPKNLAKNLMNRAMKMNPSIDREIKEEVIQYAIDNGLLMNGSSFDKSGEFVAKVMADTEKRIAALEKQGKTIQNSEIIAGARAYIDRNVGGYGTGKYLGGTQDKRIARYNFIDKKIKPSIMEYGDDMPIAAGQEMKQGYDRLLKKEFKRRQQEGASTFSTVETDGFMGTANGLRNSLNASDAGIAANNAAVSDRLQWMEHALPTLTKQGVKSMIPSEMLLPLVIESAYKGGPGIAFALGGARATLSNPSVLSMMSIASNWVKKGAPITPKITSSLLVKNAVEKLLGEEEYKKLMEEYENGSN